MKISLQRAICSLTSALDFVGIDEVHHGKRVALMAQGIASEMGWSEAQCLEMLYAGMLHDCGVSRTREHKQLTETLEWEGAQEHCLRGEQYLLACPPLAHYAPIVRRHHTRWEVLTALPDSEEYRVRANLIFLADRADVLLAPYVSGRALQNEILWEYPRIVERLSGLAGTLFMPELVAAFTRAAKREAFWLRLDPSYIVDIVEEQLQREEQTDLNMSDALAVAMLFARTVDAKSSYTLEHSTRVAKITRYLAAASGSRGADLDKIEIAGLLHDIGKLRVPEAIIDKPGAITTEERAYVQRHSYDTGRILKQVFPGEPIADWASMHHENLLGTGYPDHLPASVIPWEARLLSVADIFQALAQERPYRARMSCQDVLRKLEELKTLGRVDAEVVALVKTHADDCYTLATSG
ncbi:MAG TPA: HD domain-containing phosphohydrolase [Rhodocyclaceae bacterium]